MAGGHVLKDGRRLGVLYASLITTAIVNAPYEKLLVAKETDAEGAGPRTAVELIMSIPGIKNLSAHVIVSEIGIDMSRFPSAAHLISWACICICPCKDESAGKRRSIVSARAPIGLRPRWFSTP
jgi:transposase